MPGEEANSVTINVQPFQKKHKLLLSPHIEHFKDLKTLIGAIIPSYVT